MIRKLYFVLVLILGLSFNSCTNDISEDVLTNHSSTSSNDEAEIIKLTSGFNIKKENGVYSMGDILLSDEQVKLLDERVVFIQYQIIHYQVTVCLSVR